MPLSDLWACNQDDPDSHQAKEESHVDQQELKKLRNQQRTWAARAASLLSRLRRRLTREEGADTSPEDSARAAFQRTVLASCSTKWDPCEDVHEESLHNFDGANGRRRGVYLYYKSLAQAVVNAFGYTANLQIPHVLTININDDTNMKLGSGKRGSTEVQSVMANIQQHLVFSSAQTVRPVWFSLHQPIIALERADAQTLYSEFMAWMLNFGGYVGWRLRPWGFPADLIKAVKRQTFCFIGDALKVNDALVTRMLQTVHGRCKTDGTSQTVILQVHCGIHQAALTRKVVALGFTGYWATLVRLSHLFEGRGFRQRFQAAQAKVVTESFHFELVNELPSEATEWHGVKVKQLKLYTDSGHMGGGGKPFGKPAVTSKRLRATLQHLQIDNGDAASELFVHWCTGPGCCAGGKDQAMSRMVESFSNLFDFMCVPLLYRWKHAAAANNFVRDGFFWHRVLPRTLLAMPSMKQSMLGRKLRSNPILLTRQSWGKSWKS